MNARFALLFPLVFLAAFQIASAIDIVTLSGKTYLDVHDIQTRDSFLTFSTDSSIVRLPLSDVPPAIRQRYAPKATPTPVPADSPDPAQPPVSSNPAASETGKIPTTPHQLIVSVANRTLDRIHENMLALRKPSGPQKITPEDAFTAQTIDAAEKDALIHGRAIAFFMTLDTFYQNPIAPGKADPAGAFGQVFLSFKDAVTPVFVDPQRDLAKLPGSVTSLLASPAKVPAPRVIFTNADLSKSLYDLQLPAPQATQPEREAAIIPAVVALKNWYIGLANATH